MSLTGPHDEFLELCAVSTSGQLSEAEHRRLREHLATCPSCREALKQFEAVVDQAIPAIGGNEPSECIEYGLSWSRNRLRRLYSIAWRGKKPAGRANVKTRTLSPQAHSEPCHFPVTRPGATCGCSLPPGFCFLSLSVSTPIGLA